MKKVRIIPSIIILTLILTACFAWVQSDKNEASVDERLVYLYFPDEEALFLHPESRQVRVLKEDLPQTIVSELIKGPQNKKLYPSLPSSTRLLSLKIENQIAYVDLSQDFPRDYPGGTTGEHMALGSIVLSLTELDNIDSVQFLIEGEKVEVLAKGHIELLNPLARPISLGTVYISDQRLKTIQEMVQKGVEEWYLDPLATAKNDGPLYGMYVSGEYELLPKKEGENISEASVLHQYKGKKYIINLKQLLNKGEEGIWAITKIEEQK